MSHYYEIINSPIYMSAPLYRHPPRNFGMPLSITHSDTMTSDRPTVHCSAIKLSGRVDDTPTRHISSRRRLNSFTFSAS